MTFRKKSDDEPKCPANVYRIILRLVSAHCSVQAIIMLFPDKVAVIFPGRNKNHFSTAKRKHIIVNGQASSLLQHTKRVQVFYFLFICNFKSFTTL